jgi:hypothetical protein
MNAIDRSTLPWRRAFTACALTALTALLTPTRADAQASRLGPSFGVSGPLGGAVREPDVAYDPVNSVYLVVSGTFAHGRFVNADGAPLGAQFYVPTSGAHSQNVRVAYSPAIGGFLVTWFDTRSNPGAYQIWGRFVQFGAGGAPAFPGADFFIAAPAGGGNAELGLDVAYGGSSGRFLVVWSQIASADLAAQLVAVNGGLVGGPIGIASDVHSQGDPSVSYNPTTDQFLVGWRHYQEPVGPGAIHVRTVTGSNGAAGPIREVALGVGCYLPQVEYNPTTGQFLVAWYQPYTVYGRLLGGDGQPAGNVTPFLSNYSTYDGLGLRHNPLTNTFFAVIHGRFAENVGMQISAAAMPDGEFTVTGTGAREGSYHPRLVANTARKEWLVVTSRDFGTVYGQRIVSVNSGSGGGGGGGGGGGTTIDLSPSGAPNASWFLAEGAASGTAGGFATYYLLANENAVPVSVRAYYASDDGRLLTKMYTVPAGSRFTLDLQFEAGAGSFATVFQSLTPGADIFVERSIYWGNFEGSTGATAVKNLSQVWAFAEGSRGGEYFRNYFLLFNPLPAPAPVTAFFYLSDGAMVGKTFTVPAQGRLTIDANLIGELAGRDFATTFVADSPIVAERAMYWGSPTWIGGTAAFGVNSSHSEWHFAEGAAANNFETFYLIQNANQTPATVRVVFFPENGQPQVRDYEAPARSRTSVYLNAALGPVGGVAASFYTSPSTPVVVERSIYWGAGRVEGTATAGSPVGAYEWHLPEGTTGGQFDTFLLLSNPTSGSASVDVTLYIEGVGRFTAPPSMRIVLPPHSRRTTNMKEFLAQLGALEGVNLVGTSFSTKVKVVGNTAPIVAEHALYWRPDGANYWRSGSGGFGIPR